LGCEGIILFAFYLLPCTPFMNMIPVLKTQHEPSGYKIIILSGIGWAIVVHPACFSVL
jgi:hypothetical protein